MVYCKAQAKNKKVLTMKKIFAALAAAVMPALSCIFGCSANTPRDFVNIMRCQCISELGVDVSAGEVLGWYYDYGFFGDGKAYMKVSFTEGGLEGDAFGGDWLSFPADYTTSMLLYGSENRGAYVKDENGELLVPQIYEGLYKLVDRQPEDYRDEPLLERASKNFTLGVYDKGQDILYFYRYNS